MLSSLAKKSAALAFKTAIVGTGIYYTQPLLTHMLHIPMENPTIIQSMLNALTTILSLKFLNYALSNIPKTKTTTRPHSKP